MQGLLKVPPEQFSPQNWWKEEKEVVNSRDAGSKVELIARVAVAE